jgi:hypothetical protein
MNAAPSEIMRVLASLDPFADSALVALRPDADGARSLVAEGRSPRRGGDAEMFSALIRHLGDAVLRDSGPAAAEEAEKLLRDKASRNGELSAAACREVLPAFLPDSIRGPLADFAQKMPAETLAALNFSRLPVFLRLAVMRGVEEGTAMMRSVTALIEGEDSPFQPGRTYLPLADIRRAQKTLAEAVKSWDAAILASLPARRAGGDVAFILDAVRRLLQFTRPKLMLRFIETVTETPVADVFAVQKHVVAELERFAKTHALPRGLDAFSYARTLGRLHELLFEAVCRHIGYLKGITVKRLVQGEARMLMQSDIRLTVGNLLRLYFNDMIRDLPAARELKMRASVKGFDHEGIHADFMRDCIARRDSFTIHGIGKLRNAADREQAVAGGRRDLEFFEQRMEAYAKAVATRRERTPDDGGDMEEGPEAVAPPEWDRPDVRHSPSMTPDDLKAAREGVMLGIPDVSLRMVVTALANQGSLRLLEAFYGRDPGSGVAPRGHYKQMTMTFTPGADELAVSALLFHDTLNAEGRGSAGAGSVDEAPLGDISFTQIEYTAVIRPRRSPEGNCGPGWRVAKVLVDTVFTYLLPGPE